MLHTLICSILILASLTVPASAASLEDGTDGTVSTESTSAEDPVDLLEVQEVDSGIALYSIDGDLHGGYYFIADCALGSDLKFYVPVEWAHDAFTLDSSGDLVNLTNSTCYAYCPDYPNYTFSCSRFNTFTYRSSSYDTQDLNITHIPESNIYYFNDSEFHLSENNLLHLIAALIFILAAIIIIRRN